MDVMHQVGKSLKPLVPIAASLTDEHVATHGLLQNLLQIFRQYWKAHVLLRNASTYALCVSSVDGTNEPAKKLYGQVQELWANCRKVYEPASLILDLCPHNLFYQFLDTDDDTRAARFILEHSRKMALHRLSLEEENMLTSMGVTGHSAWGSLYSDLSSVLTVVMKDEETGEDKQMGIATAEAMRDSPHENIRRKSWEAIREAWLPHQETCAAALNAITGWRLELYEQRGFDSFLTASLHANRMSEKTLKTLLHAIDSKADVGRRALKIQAKMLGKEALAPWDLFAPAPGDGGGVGKLYTFDEGIELISRAVGEVDVKGGEFVTMMKDKLWIEASRGDKKRPGAYCTGFAKTRTPRVYLSDYNGRAQLLQTTAHEIGHAFHSWQMRDLPQSQLSYPMNLAETASIFFETVVGNALLEQARTPQERFNILWGDAESAATFLLNIPARYRFEEELNMRRKEGKLSAKEIDDMMVRAWNRYYGDALEGTERVGVFSQSKLHFYLTGISFYNWPYSFGYLFALGVYAAYEKMPNPDMFPKMYKDLLRDTGRMSAEEVIEKHLGGRIDEPQFWLDAIAVAERKIDMLEKVAGELPAN